MKTALLKSNNLELLESTLNSYINVNVIFYFNSLAKSAINLNKTEAFKLIYNKFILSNPSSCQLSNFFEDVFLTSCEYNRNKILSFLFSKEEFKIDPLCKKIGFSFAACNNVTFDLLINKYKLEEDYYADIIYKIIQKRRKKNKKHVYSMTQKLINKFGYFPSEKLYNKILENKSFERLNTLFYIDDFEFSDYLLSFDLDKYIIRNYKSLLSGNNKIIESKYDNIIKGIKISNF